MRSCSLLLATFLLLGNCAPKPISLIRKATIQQSSFNQTIPYTKVKRIIVVKMRLNNQRTYRFIWDTGAAVTVLSRKVVKELGLKPLTKMKITDSHKRRKTLEMVNLRKVELGGVKFKNIAGLVVDYPKTSALPCYADGGIIGTNLIARCNWTIDYARQILTFTNQPYHLHKNPQAIPFKTGFSGKMYFSARILNKTIGNILLDSGSNGALDLKSSNSLQANILKKYPATRILDGTTQGLYGTRLDTVYKVHLDSIQIGQLAPISVPIEFSKYTGRKVGNKVLENFKIKIDYTNKRMLWQVQTVMTDNHKLFGLVLKRLKNGKVVIGSLYEPSEATKKGLKLNTEIVQINDKPLQDYFKDSCSFYDWQFTMNKMSKLKITLKNGEKIQLVKKALRSKIWYKSK